MDATELISWIFGPIVITALAATLAFLTNLLNLRDRFVKWRKEKNERKKKIDEPRNEVTTPKIQENFIFKIGFISNSEPGRSILTISIINKSGEVKFVDPLSYNFQFKQNPNLYQPPTMVMNNEKWPKRLEHGERFATSFEFQSILNNTLFQYWNRDVLVFATTRTTIGDELKSNSIEYDKLAEKLNPLNSEYNNLAKTISERLNGHYRELYVSLWQLQIFKRFTVHIAKQLNDCGLPILDFLIKNYGLTIEKYPWSEWYKPLEEMKIPPSEIEIFLHEFLKSKEN
jgi:hypothetical protein